MVTCGICNHDTTHIKYKTNVCFCYKCKRSTCEPVTVYRCCTCNNDIIVDHTGYVLFDGKTKFRICRKNGCRGKLEYFQDECEQMLKTFFD